MSGSDSDLPDLVDSDEDTPLAEKIPQRSNVDYVDIWLRKSEKFLEKQENFIRIFSLGPFLFALNNLVPKPWMTSLQTAGLLLNDKREKDLSGLDWEEWSLVDLVENVISVMLKKLRKKHHLVCVLNSVDCVELLCPGDHIDINLALKEVEKIDGIKKLWDKALKSPSCRKKEKETKFALLYVGKLYHLIVIGLARDCKDVAEEIRKSLRQKGVDTVKLKDTGNLEYQTGKFESACDYYARAARADPLNHIYFGNRAQVNNKLKRYRDALADGRRAILLKPDWTKGHYRYAQAFYELDKLDMAITVNRKGQEICSSNKGMTDKNNFKELIQQGENFKKERDDNIRKEKIRKALENAVSDDKDLPEALKALPGQKRVINLSEAWKMLDDEPNADMDVPELISSGSDSSDEDVPKLVEDEEEPPKKKPAQSVKNNDKTKATKSTTSSKSEQNNKSTTAGKTTKQPVTESSKTKKMATPAVVENNKKSVPERTTKQAKKLTKKMSPKKSENAEFDEMLKEGSEAHLSGLSKNAVTIYKKALDMATNNSIESLGLDDLDFVTLKFAYGFASVTTGLLKFILEGIEKFNDIIKNHEDVRFPLAYYGLGKAYISLNRYLEAISPLKTGLRIVDRFKCTIITWPGTQSKIEEGVPEKLRNLMKELLRLCNYPPKPDAQCRYHSDREEDKILIYFADPDFKGFVRMFCRSRCKVEFHNTCWKVYKAKFGDKSSDKDLLDTPCPTPDCTDVICKILIFRQDSNFKLIESEKTHKEPKPRKPLKKLPLSNIYKIERKRERKELRKQRRQEFLEELDDLSDKETEDNNIPASVERKNDDEQENASGGAPKTENSQEENVDKKPVAVLSKDEEDWKLARYKGTKKQKNAKKKKEKTSKTVINLEVNFTGDREKVLLGEDAADSEDILEMPKIPRSYAPMKVTDHQEVVAKETEIFDDCTATLLTFFEDMLRENGPMHVQDTVISSMLEEFPKEAKDRIDSAGGLLNFLQKSSKFSVCDGIVCLFKDAVKAREISQARKLSVKNLNKNQFSVNKENPWKTIGKVPVDSEHIDKSDFPSISGTQNGVENRIQNSEHFSASNKMENIASIDDIDDFSVPSDNISISSDTIRNTMKNTYNSLDDFAAMPENKSDSQTLSTLDCMDSIDDIPLYTKTKKVKKKHLDDLDDFKSLSETDSESAKDSNVSDGVRMSNAEKLKSSMWEDKLDYYKSQDKLSGDQMSRSSSRSDLSEHSDISAELMAKAYKQPNRHSPLATSTAVSKTTWPTKDVGLPPASHGFGPVGSPIPTSSIDKGFDVTISKPLPSFSSGHNAMTLHQEVAEATAQQIRKIDTELVNELAEEVVDQIYFGKNVSESQRSLTFDRVTKDIWSDFKRSSESSNFPMGSNFQARFPFGNTSRIGENTGEFSMKKKSFAEQFMKNHYQQKTNTDPTGLGETFLSPFSASQGYSTVTSNSIWSHSNPMNKMVPSSFPNPPPPLNLPPSKTNPFGNITIGTSIGTSSVSEPLPPFPSFSASPFSSSQNINSVSTKDQSVQVAMETKSVETNTDPYEPFKDDYYRAKEERDFFEESLKSATAQLQEIATLLHDRDQKCKLLEADVMTKCKAFEEERQSTKRDREQLTNEITTLQQAVTLQREAELEQLKARAELETKIAELVKSQNEQREAKQILINEKMDALKNKEEFRKNFEEELERAKYTEIELLKTKEGYAMQMLQRSHKEAIFYMKNLTDMIKKRGDSEQQIPPRIQKALDHYKNISQKCDETITRLKSEFEDQILQIQSGKKLADLPSIFIPPPPPPLPMNFMSQDQPQGNNQFNPTSVPQLSSLAQASAAVPPPKPLTPVNVSASVAPSVTVPITTMQQPKPLAPPPGLQARALATGSQPRQPAPLSAAQGIVPPRPTSFVRPMTPSLVAGVPAVQHQHKNSFEKLISRLQVIFPRYNRAVFTRCIQELRASRGNSLSGMTLDEIVQQVTELILSHERRQNLSSSQPAVSVAQDSAAELSAFSKTVGPPPGLSQSWAFQAGAGDSGNSQTEVFEEEEDPCVICHEEMALQPCMTLDCKHRFHDECIRKWFREQSTCPNCRIHALLPDEFPSLK